MAEESDERTEEATQARRDEFRKQGQIASTRELATVIMLTLAAGVVTLFVPWAFLQVSELFALSIEQQSPLVALNIAATKLMYILAPVLLLALIAGVSSSVLQTGFLVLEDGLKFDLERLNPLEGFKRVFSFKAGVEGVKSVLKMLGLLIITYFTLKSKLSEIPTLSQATTLRLALFLGEISSRLLMTTAIAMLVLAGVDYFLQWWDLEKRMRMSKQEIKDEHKNREGDPLIKSRVRKIQREVANRRMMDKVPKATVIVTNPTHIAVALRYDDNLPAPQLVAKGADLLAEKIKTLAREHGIPIVENKPLARAIFKTMKIGHVIPRDLFVAVAEVLSYVYKLRKRGRSNVYTERGL